MVGRRTSCKRRGALGAKVNLVESYQLRLNVPQGASGLRAERRAANERSRRHAHAEPLLANLPRRNAPLSLAASLNTPQRGRSIASFDF